MNERIKEFSKEAGSAADATYAKGPDAIWFREYNKKFVELIISECANVAADHDALDIYEEIREHFGVNNG